jgi:hypothetical protein
MSRAYYLGLDVHQEKVAIAHTAAGEREDPKGLPDGGGHDHD